MKSSRFRLASFAAALIAACAFSVGVAHADNQTPDTTPVLLPGSLPYNVALQQYNFGAADLPTLHSYAAAHYDGKWILFAGKTNGLHTFDTTGPNGFTPETQNREVWVIDPVAKQSWHRSLEGVAGGLTTDELNSITPTNNQFVQRDNRFYMTGGYGVQSVQANGTPVNGTFDKLTAIDLPGITNWVMTGAGTAKNSIRQIADPIFRVTGGAMYDVNGRTQLIFGQSFSGNYNPGKNGTYTQQVRNFDIVDDGMTLSVANISSTASDPNYRRRDLNVFPTLTPGAGNTVDKGVTVLSGVFTPTFGAWTVPVEIDANGNPTMDDPNLASTFKQGYNGYHSAKLGMYSESEGSMHELLFGGISLQFMDTNTMLTQTDPNMPFINDITSVVVDSAGNYSQHWIGQYPIINDIDQKRLRFGANAEFFLAEGVPTYDNGVIKLDQLTQPTVLGYIFGGLTANGPHTQSGDPPAVSAASNRIFTVMFNPVVVPEPGSISLAGFGIAAVLFRRQRRHQ